MPSPRGIAAAVVAAASLPAASALYVNGSLIAPCDSPLYCQGEILKQIELARPFSDSKTYVDMPTIKPLDEVIAAFEELEKPLSNNTALQDFLTTYFAAAGGELQEVDDAELETDPVFLDKVESSTLAEFGKKVISIWPDLTRKYGGSSADCDGCVDSFLEINRTFVVAGGRFREAYYWDSFWIIEGLLRTGGSFTEIAKNMIENFLDFVEMLGFVPNGSREYYRNRSQPPLLSAMVKTYVDYTNDTSILERAVPLLIKEHDFWMTNRTVEVEKDGETYTLNRYAVRNTQPRPESYREDYITATNKSYYAESGIIYPEVESLNETELMELYGHLASGAESGWDYGSRWIATPDDAVRDVYFPLRSLNTMNMVPVDLNSILYMAESSIASLLSSQGNDTSEEFATMAEKRSAAMVALLWNEEHFRFFDYNMTSSSQHVYVHTDDDATDVETEDAPEGKMVFWNVAQLYPFWTGAAPRYLRNNPFAVLKAFEPVSNHLENMLGAIPATNLETGQQWDEPNVWPPLQYIIMKGLLSTEATFGEDDPAYVSVNELALKLAQRYTDSTFCTWYATGGSAGAFEKLDGIDDGVDGVMFEKYDSNSTNVAGGGGEYTVVEGFGWTNGVLLWTLDQFGDILTTPECGDIEAADVHEEGGGAKRRMGRRAVELDPPNMTEYPNHALLLASLASRSLPGKPALLQNPHARVVPAVHLGSNPEQLRIVSKIVIRERTNQFRGET
ncbi:hypothetical protein MKZ38_002255 [Zalerion maritima]|uniref:Trehalase n=1 Tax=Zalerion maritima TaxID=339359 RepID=A0AAD5WT93_9PEZI|nr:hypothetical protein MKZ38_002255 [Zalerion maritima]